MIDAPGRDRRTVGWWAGRLAAAAAVVIAIGVVAQRNDRDWPDGPTGGTGDLAVREKVGHGDTETLGRDATDGEKAKEFREAPELAAVDNRGSGRALGKGGFAKDGVAEGHDKDGGLAGGDESVELWMNTPDPELAKVQFEHTLTENYRVQPGVVEDTGAARAAETQVIRPRGNYYNQSQSGPNRIVYEVVLPREQLDNLKKDFNELRAAQHVAQVPLVDSPKKEAGEMLADQLALAEARQQLQPKSGIALSAPAEDEGKLLLAKAAGQPAAARSAPGAARKIEGPCPPAAAAPTTAPLIAPAVPATRAAQPADGAVVAQAATVPATAPAVGKAGSGLQLEQPGYDHCLGAVVQTQPAVEGVQMAQVRLQRTEHGAAATQAAAGQAGSNAALSRMIQLRVVLNGVPTGFSAADVRALELHLAEPPASEPAK